MLKEKHTFSNAWLNGITGNDMEHGFITGALTGGVSSLGNSAIDAGGGNLGYKVICSAILGGTVEEIGGGKFANGAVTGAYGMLFNEAMHQIDGKEIKGKELGLSEETDAASVIDAIYTKMGEGDNISGGEFASILPINFVKKAAISVGIDKIERTKNGIKLKFVGFSKLKVGHLELLGDMEYKIEPIKTKNDIPYYHIAGPGSASYDTKQVPINFYIYGNRYSNDFKFKHASNVW